MAKLIALKDIRNNFGAKVEDPDHDNHIHKGALFTIGEDQQGKDIPLSKLSTMTGPERLLIGSLHAAQAIGDATDAKLVASVQEEADDERESREADAKTTKAAGSSADVVAQLVAALKPQPVKADK